MKCLSLIFLFFSPFLHGDKLERILQRIQDEYYSDEPNFEVVREQVSALNKSMAQTTYPFHNRVRWWHQPAEGLLLKLDKIADTLAPYEQMLIDLAYYEGVQQGYVSTLSTLLNAKPTETLKVGLENYLLGDYSRGIPERSLLVLYTLNLADDALYQTLFQQIANREYRSQDFRTLRMLASRNDPVPEFADALLAMIRKRVEKISKEDSRGILELSDIAKSYSKMIDGMGLEILPVALELEKLVMQIMSSPYKDEVLAIYPNLEGQFSSIMKRIRNDQKIEVPPMGYGLVIKQNNISSLEPAPELVKVVEEVGTVEARTTPEPVIEAPAEMAVDKPIKEGVEKSSNWWLWLIGLPVAIGALGLALRRKN